jgi:hypothetical protein
MLFVGIGNNLVVLINLFGQLLEVLIRSWGLVERFVDREETEPATQHKYWLCSSNSS